MKKYVLALDQGTTSSRTIVFDKKGRIVSKAQFEFEQIYPNSGWVEHNPYEILDSQLRSLSSALMNVKINPKEIAAIGITNQRETTIVWDRETGEPIYNAIVWQSRQSQDICEEIIKKGYEDKIILHENFWLPDEALSLYSKSKGVFCNEMHSPIISIGNGIPATVGRWKEQTTKGLMWKSIGLSEWLFDMDNESDRKKVSYTILSIFIYV